MVIDNWLNVISSVLSIGAITGGGIVFLIDQASKKREAWIATFQKCDTHGLSVKAENLKRCFAKYKSKDKVRRIFLEALVDPHTSEFNCSRHFEEMWNTHVETK